MKVIRNSKFWSAWLIIVTLLVAAVWHYFERIPQSPTRDSFLGNLLATVLGLIVGIPIALEINKAQERSELKSKGLEKQNREVKVLKLVKCELEYNRELLSTIVEKQKENPTTILYLGLKNDLWTTLSDGGELQWIDDLELLDAVSTAYYHIRCLIPLEENYFEPGFLIGMHQTKSDGSVRKTYQGERTVDRATSLRPEALKSVESVLEIIEQHLESKDNKIAV